MSPGRRSGAWDVQLRYPWPRGIGALACAAALAVEAPGVAQDPPTGEAVEEATAKTPLLGAPTDLPVRRIETVEVAADTVLYSEPERGSLALETIDVASELEVLERRAGWARVRRGGLLGWVLLAAGRGGRDAPAAVAIAADPAYLNEAVALLGEDVRPLFAAGYRVYTDIRQARIRRSILDLMEEVERVYADRFGVEVPAPVGEAVVVFERQESYRRYASAEPSIRDLELPGHSGHGIAAVYAGNRELAEVLSSLVHEQTHLLNRRTLAFELPAWLEEGICEDLSFSRLDSAGRLVPGTLRLSRTVTRRVEIERRGRRTTTSVEIRGPVAALQRLLKRRGDGSAPVLRELITLPWAAFVADDRREAHYTLAAFLVRFLLDGSDGRHAAAFRRYVASGPAPSFDSAVELERALGVPLEELEQDLWRWLERQTTY